MGLSVRDWMVIVGVLLVVAVLLDGYRRMRQEWRSQIRSSLSKAGSDRAGSDKDGFDTNSELPNGGARVVARSERRGARVEPRISYAVDPLHDRTGRAQSPHREKRDLRSDLGGDGIDGERLRARSGMPGAEDGSPLDTDAMDGDRREASAPAGAWDADHPSPAAGFDAEGQGDPVDRDPVPVRPDRLDQSADRWGHTDGYRQDGESAAASAGREMFPERSERSTASRSAEPASVIEDAGFFEAVDEAPSLGPADEVVVINVLAKDRPFSGPELLQILLTCDLRFGKMNIFHRYEQAGGKGALQFSVANIVEPGVFNLDRIDDFTTRGVCFFLTLPGPQEPLVAFNYMVETAQCLVRNLNGELRDEAHSVMTAQTLEHCRARIREFERRQLTRSPR